MKWIITFLLTLVFGCVPALYQAKQINVSGDYHHNVTKTTFPEHYHDYIRKTVTAFDKEHDNIGVTYALFGDEKRLSFTVYIYPAGAASEDRLRNQYFESLGAIATAAGREIDATQHPFFYSRNQYKFVGINALMRIGPDATSLTVFECGKWFLKLRIASQLFDLKSLDSIQASILENFSPADIVAKYPLNIGADVRVAPAAFRDSALLRTVLAGVMKKVDWTVHNVDSLEKCSGFPGMYLATHTEPLREMIKTWKTLDGRRSSSTDEYFKELQRINDSGFLDEFVMDQYDNVLMPPDTVKIDFDAYNTWKQLNKPKINLREKYYIIGYEFSK